MNAERKPRVSGAQPAALEAEEVVSAWVGYAAGQRDHTGSVRDTLAFHVLALAASHELLRARLDAAEKECTVLRAELYGDTR